MTKYYALVMHTGFPAPIEYEGEFGNSEEAWEYFEKVHGEEDVYAVNTFSIRDIDKKEKTVAVS